MGGQIRTRADTANGNNNFGFFITTNVSQLHLLNVAIPLVNDTSDEERRLILRLRILCRIQPDAETACGASLQITLGYDGGQLS